MIGRLRIKSILILIFLCNQYLISQVAPVTKNKKVIQVTTAISLAYIMELSYLGSVWYKDKQRVPFNIYDDSDTFLQVDKWGHAYGAYYISTVGYHLYLWAGLNKKKALWYGGSLGFFFQLPIEIFDGLHQGFGFSWWDVLANFSGTSLFLLQELLFKEQLVLMKFSFYPSPYSKYAPRVLGSDFSRQLMLDFNAHTYWLSFNLQKISGIKKMPPWLNLAFGYGGDGILGEKENLKSYDGEVLPTFKRVSQYYLSLDIDFSRIKLKNKNLKSFFNLILIKFPFPTIEYNSNEGFKFLPLFF